MVGRVVGGIWLMEGSRGRKSRVVRCMEFAHAANGNCALALEEVSIFSWA